MPNAELKTAMLLHKGAAAQVMPPHCSAALPRHPPQFVLSDQAHFLQESNQILVVQQL